MVMSGNNEMDIKQKNPFDKTVANALANGEVEMSINKNVIQQEK